MRASGTETPEAYDGITGIMSIAENNGQGIRAAFTLRNNLYFVKERSMYVTATDGVNEPALWQVEEVSNQGWHAFGARRRAGRGVGDYRRALRACISSMAASRQKSRRKSSPRGTQSTGSTASSSGCRWIRSTSAIFIGVPMGAATQPNQVLMLDYTEGFGDPLIAMLTAPLRSRKWAPWTIAANSCALIERSTGVAEVFFGSNNSSGKIYALTPGAYSDDGAAINSFYSTAFLAATGAALSGRNLFGYLTAYVQGSGSLALVGAFAGRRRLHRARLVDARLARLARHGAIHQRPRRARLVSDRHQCRRLVVLAHEARAMGKARSVRNCARRELTFLRIVERWISFRVTNFGLPRVFLHSRRRCVPGQPL